MPSLHYGHLQICSLLIIPYVTLLSYAQIRDHYLVPRIMRANICNEWKFRDGWFHPTPSGETSPIKWNTVIASQWSAICRLSNAFSAFRQTYTNGYSDGGIFVQVNNRNIGGKKRRRLQNYKIAAARSRSPGIMPSCELTINFPTLLLRVSVFYV